MLVVPYLSGLILAARSAMVAPVHPAPRPPDLTFHLARPSPWYAATLFAFWMLGYFAFNALSVWLKTGPFDKLRDRPDKLRDRRDALRRPLIVYALAAAVFGLATLALAGPAILGWVPVYAVLLVPAIVLAAQRHERATLGGGLTTAAASLMILVVTHPDPAALLNWTPYARSAVALAALLFGYFFGTVLYVKTNIRERGSRAFYTASVLWHGLVAAAAAALAAAGAASVWWVGLFAVATLRAVVVPRLQPPVTPLRIGLLEIGLSVAILAIVACA